VCVLQYYLFTIYTKQLSFKCVCSTVLFVYNLHETAELQMCVFYSNYLFTIYTKQLSFKCRTSTVLFVKNLHETAELQMCVLQYYLLTIYTKQLSFKCVFYSTICLQSTRKLGVLRGESCDRK